MTTLELETQLGLELGVDETRYPSATRCVHLNEAIEGLSIAAGTMCEDGAPWDQADGTFATAVGTAGYDLDSKLSMTVQRPLRVFYGAVELDPCSREDYLRWYPPGTANGVPVVWCWWKKQLLFGPPPSAITTVTLDVLTRPAPLSHGAPTGHNGWTDNAAPTVIRSAAALACPYLKEPAQTAAYSEIAQAELAKMVERWAADAALGGRGAAAGTLAQLRDLLGTMVGVRSTRQYPLATRDLHINEAIASLSLESDSPWDESTAAISLAAGDPDQNLLALLPGGSPTLVRPLALYIADKPVQPITPEDYHARRELAPANGTPTAWAWWAGDLLLVPTPSALTAAVLEFRSRPAAMTLGTATNAWTTGATSAVLHRAAAKALPHLGRPEEVAYHEGQSKALLAPLLAEWALRHQRGGKVADATTLRGAAEAARSLLGATEASYPRSVRYEHVNLAIERLSLSSDAPYDEVTADIAILVGITEYIPDTELGVNYPHFMRPLMLSYLYDGAELALDFRSLEELKDIWPEQSAPAHPQDYALWGGGFVVRPEPDAAYTAHLSYRGRPRRVTTDAGTNAWLTGAPNLVAHETARLGALLWLKDAQRAAELGAIVDALLEAYKVEWSDAQQTARHDQHTVEPGGKW